MQTIAISIDTPTLTAVDRLRRGKSASKTSRSEFIRRAVQHYLAELDLHERETRESAVVERHYKKLNAQARAALEDQVLP